LINLTNKVLVFDLDDTLYDSRKFTNQGFNNVATFLSKKTKIKKKNILKEINKIYYSEKKYTFNKLLKFYSLKKNLLASLINIYRYSKKNLNLYKDAQYLLKKIDKKKTFLLTDGNKLMQGKKIKYLALNKYFKKILKTNQYGLKYNKPSNYCFSIICKNMNCKMTDIVYIGDNPNKDFIIKQSGVVTIRLLRGIYRNQKLGKKKEADYEIKNLREILNYL